MLATFFRFVRLPEPYGSRLGYREMSCTEVHQPHYYLMVLELAAWLKGEVACPSSIFEVLDLCDGLDLRGELEKIKSLPSYVIPTDIVVKSNDGGSIHSFSASLRRHFHFFDDYLSTFSIGEVSVPYPERVLREVLKMDRDSPLLIDHIDCIRYLNPKDPFFYLTFNTTGTSSHILREITTLFSMKDMRDALIATGSKMSYRYDLGFLTPALRHYGDVKNIKELFADSPSYLALILSSTPFAQEAFHQHMLTTDFSSSDEVDYVIYQKWVETAIIKLILDSKDWSEIQRWLAMINCHSPMFGTDKLHVAAPYHIHLSVIRLTAGRTRDIAKKIQEFILFSEEEILKELNK